MMRVSTSVWLFCIILSSLIAPSLCTKCYVCGDNSSVADQCVDDYSRKMTDVKDCSDSAVSGCMKSKYVDADNKQIVTRRCAPEVGMRHTPNECKSTEVQGQQVFFCHCTDDFCNGSTQTSHSLLLLILGVVCLLA